MQMGKNCLLLFHYLFVFFVITKSFFINWLKHFIPLIHTVLNLIEFACGLKTLHLPRSFPSPPPHVLCFIRFITPMLIVCDDDSALLLHKLLRRHWVLFHLFIYLFMNSFLTWWTLVVIVLFLLYRSMFHIRCTSSYRPFKYTFQQRDMVKLKQPAPECSTFSWSHSVFSSFFFGFHLWLLSCLWYHRHLELNLMHFDSLLIWPIGVHLVACGAVRCLVGLLCLRIVYDYDGQFFGSLICKCRTYASLMLLW